MENYPDKTTKLIFAITVLGGFIYLAAYRPDPDWGDTVALAAVKLKAKEVGTYCWHEQDEVYCVTYSRSE